MKKYIVYKGQKIYHGDDISGSIYGAENVDIVCQRYEIETAASIEEAISTLIN